MVAGGGEAFLVVAAGGGEAGLGLVAGGGEAGLAAALAGVPNCTPRKLLPLEACAQLDMSGLEGQICCLLRSSNNMLMHEGVSQLQQSWQP